MKKKVLIIGCGSIGALKDNKFDSKRSENILTWAHAFYNNKLTEELIFYDLDVNKTKEAAMKWYGTWISDLNSLPSIKPNIIVVAVDTLSHYDIMSNIVSFENYRSELVICEKPFTNSLNTAYAINTLYNYKKIPIMVNYTRRFIPKIMELKKKLNNLKIYNAILTYTRGFKRDGCHAIDLFNYLFGKFRKGYILDRHNPILDFSDNDPTYAAYLSYEKCNNVFFAPIDGRDYDIFDINIYCEGTRFEITNHGQDILVYKAKAEKTYGDYKSMPYTFNRLEKTDLTKALTLAVENAYDFLNNGKELICTSKEAINVHKIYKVLEV